MGRTVSARPMLKRRGLSRLSVRHWGRAWLVAGLLSGCMTGPWPFGYESHRAMHYGGDVRYWDRRMGIPGMMGPDDGAGGLNTLDLTEGQRERIALIREQLHREDELRRVEWLAARDALQARLNAPAPDPEAVAAAYDRMADLERAGLRARVQAHNRIRALLTETQRARLPGMMSGVAR